MYVTRHQHCQLFSCFRLWWLDEFHPGMKCIALCGSQHTPSRWTLRWPRLYRKLFLTKPNSSGHEYHHKPRTELLSHAAVDNHYTQFQQLAAGVWLLLSMGSVQVFLAAPRVDDCKSLCSLQCCGLVLADDWPKRKSSHSALAASDHLVEDELRSHFDNWGKYRVDTLCSAVFTSSAMERAVRIDQR